MKTPVYLSAPGLVCCAGMNRAEFLDAACRGDQSGIRPLTLTGGQTFLAGRVPDEKLSPTGDPFDMKLFRMAAFALRQIEEEVRAAVSLFGAGRVGVCVGSSDNATEHYLPAHRAFFTEGSFPAAYALHVQAASYPADFVCRLTGAAGPALTVATACASSAGAVAQAEELLAAGFCDAVIAGGLDVASETVLRGFASLEAVAEGVCNPFSKNRAGITLGDGAAFFVVSREDFSGMGITLLGAGECADAYHMTAPHPEGDGARRAMERALARAGLNPRDIAYVNLHGTGTPLNDSMEAKALAAVFGGDSPLSSSSKPLTGHTLGAAGALELALCHTLLASPRKAVPVHRWDGIPDDSFPAPRLAACGDTAENMRAVMSNSFGFGGCNVSLVLGKKD